MWFYSVLENRILQKAVQKTIKVFYFYLISIHYLIQRYINDVI
jgi:hypothetical protein